MTSVTQTQNRWGIGTLIDHTDGFADEADVSDVDCEPSTIWWKGKYASLSSEHSFKILKSLRRKSTTKPKIWKKKKKKKKRALPVTFFAPYYHRKHLIEWVWTCTELYKFSLILDMLIKTDTLVVQLWNCSEETKNNQRFLATAS